MIKFNEKPGIKISRIPALDTLVFQIFVIFYLYGIDYTKIKYLSLAGLFLSEVRSFNFKTLFTGGLTGLSLWSRGRHRDIPIRGSQPIFDPEIWIPGRDWDLGQIPKISDSFFLWLFFCQKLTLQYLRNHFSWRKC